MNNNNIENKNLYDSFDIFGKKKLETENFGKIEIYFEQEIHKIKINTVFYPTIYAKQWLKNNKDRIGIKAHGLKPVHKYKKYSIIKLSNNTILELDKSIELCDNIKNHIKEIIQKLNSRTLKEFVFSHTSKKYK